MAEKVYLSISRNVLADVMDAFDNNSVGFNIHGVKMMVDNQHNVFPSNLS